MPERIHVLSDRIALVHGRHGPFLVNRHDKFVGQALIDYGEYAENESEMLIKLIAPGSIVIEAGANIGSHTIALARAAGAVIAIEPQPSLFHLLCANVAMNVPDRAHPIMAGCGKTAGDMAMPAVNYGVSGNFGAVSLSTEGAIPTRIIPIDELGFNGRLGLIKIDVEGMEAEVVLGAQNAIRQHRPFLYIENDRVEKSPHLIGTVKALGYELWWHVTPLFNPRNFFANADNKYPNLGSINMVCVPNEVNITTTALKGAMGELVAVTGPDHHPLKR
jgi:FkbM family methyltransferase